MFELPARSGPFGAISTAMGGPIGIGVGSCAREKREAVIKTRVVKIVNAKRASGLTRWWLQGFMHFSLWHRGSCASISEHIVLTKPKYYARSHFPALLIIIFSPHIKQGR